MMSKFAIKCVLIAICMVNFSFSDPFVSSKASIMPVKLIHLKNEINNSTKTFKEDDTFSSKAKISKIVPMMRFSHKFFGTNFTQSKTDILQKNSTVVKLMKPQFKAKNSNEKHKSKSGRKREELTHSSVFISTTPSLRTTTQRSDSTTSAESLTSSTFVASSSDKKSQLALSPESWDYLKSVLKDEELEDILNGLTFDVIQNASSQIKANSKAAETYLINILFSEADKLKKSRMLEVKELASDKINTGVRYSAKHRPVLNVNPLYKQEKVKNDQRTSKVKGITKQLIRELDPSSIDYKNVSGHISNLKPDSPRKFSNFTVSKSKVLVNGEPSKTKPVATASSLMHVLIAPEFVDVKPTPFSRSLSSNSNGFIPVFPMATQNGSKDKASDEVRENIELHNVVHRKARGPPKEDEYQLPSLTTTSTVKPNEEKGYQTITEATTLGPKIVWYHHDQTPEDTFYPNSDSFLVPPEEEDIQVLTDLKLMKPVQEDLSKRNPDSFSDSYSSSSQSKGDSGKKLNSNEIDTKTAIKNDNNKTPFKSTNTHLNSRNSDYVKKNNDVALQQQGTSVVDHYPDDEYNSGSGRGGSGRMKPTQQYDHEAGRYYDSPTPTSFAGDIKNPNKPFITTDISDNFAPVNEYGNYRDSYPNRYEIRNLYNRQRNKDNFNVGNNDLPLRGDYGYERNQDGFDGEFQYHSQKPIGNDRYRDSLAHGLRSGYYGQNQGSGHNNNHGSGHNKNVYGQNNYGWKDPSKDLFTKAKAYLKNSDFSTAEKWFDISIGVLAFLAFGGYVIMLIYQIFTVSSTTPVGTLVGKSFMGAGEIFDLFLTKGRIGHEYIDELEMIVKRAMANVKRIWLTKQVGETKWSATKLKGELSTE